MFNIKRMFTNQFDTSLIVSINHIFTGNSSIGRTLGLDLRGWLFESVFPD